MVFRRRTRKKFLNYIEENFTSDKVTFVDNKGIGINDLVFDDASAAEVIERFKEAKVDAVMIINCNFGNEEAAADIAAALGKPVLIWAPLDEANRVKNDELVEFPYGYHTTVATPGYQTYFLWLMAGDYQGFNRSNDPLHDWIANR